MHTIHNLFLTTFSNQDKRDFVVRRLREMGFVIKYVPDSTFYL